MGFFYLVEIFAFITFLAMSVSQLLIITVMLYGDGESSDHLKDNFLVALIIIHTLLLILSFTFVCQLIPTLTFSSSGDDPHHSDLESQNRSTGQSGHREERDSDDVLIVLQNATHRCQEIRTGDEVLIGGSVNTSTVTSSSAPLDSSVDSPSTNMNNSNESRREATTGMACGVKRQLATILDEFWGLLFDYHGKPTEEAGVRAPMVLGLTFELSEMTVEPSMNTPDTEMVCSTYPSGDSPNVMGSPTIPYCAGYYSYRNSVSMGPMQYMAYPQLYYTSYGNQLTFETKNNSPQMDLTWGGLSVTDKDSEPKGFLTYRETECLLIQSLRLCIRKLIKLEGSDWLFGLNGGCDEDLIARFASSERILDRVDPLEENNGSTISLFTMPYCVQGCILQASLVVSFGVWCVHRILELLLQESRPELWGKYTYVLNCLQGILDPAFCNPRRPRHSCKCLQLQEEFSHTELTLKSFILELIQNVHVAISSRRAEPVQALEKPPLLFRKVRKMWHRF